MPSGSRRYYTPSEVSGHDRAEDCWVSIFGRVYDLTSLLKEHMTILAQPIINNAGKDISYWFDAETGDVKMHMNPATELRVPYTPMGRFIHIPPPEPDVEWDNTFEVPWWKVKHRCLVPRRVAMGHVHHWVAHLTRANHTPNSQCALKG